jgi:hypothetical protein
VLHARVKALAKRRRQQSRIEKLERVNWAKL